MANRLTVEEVEQLVTQLPLPERLRLVARVCTQLAGADTAASDAAQARQERLAQADAWITACDQVAELWDGDFDSAADLRRLRNDEE